MDRSGASVDTIQFRHQGGGKGSLGIQRRDHLIASGDTALDPDRHHIGHRIKGSLGAIVRNGAVIEEDKGDAIEERTRTAGDHFKVVIGSNWTQDRGSAQVGLHQNRFIAKDHIRRAGSESAAELSAEGNIQLFVNAVDDRADGGEAEVDVDVEELAAIPFDDCGVGAWIQATAVGDLQWTLIEQADGDIVNRGTRLIGGDADGEEVVRHQQLRAGGNRFGTICQHPSDLGAHAILTTTGSDESGGGQGRQVEHR